MRVLMLPYLYFKDENQSSGIVHQSGLAKALAAAGNMVVVVMPSGAGWKYDHERWFGGFDNMTVRPVEYPQDLNMTAGMISPELARLLTPEQTDVPFDVVFCGIPEAAMSLKRFLYKKGHTRLNTPVVTYFDSVFGYDENGKSRAGRGGSNPDFVRELMYLQALSTLECPAVLHIPNEAEALRRNVRGLLSPANARTAMGNIHRVYRPYTPPQSPVQRVLKGEVYRVFVARSFGDTDEEAGYQTEPLIRAIKYLSVKGVPVKTVLATQSPLDDWARGVIDEAGDSIEVMHKRPREEVLAALYDCELSAYLTDYNGLYMSSIEAVCSGSPHLHKETRFSAGEVNSPFSVKSYDVEEIMAAIEKMVSGFDDVAYAAYVNAQIQCDLRCAPSVGLDLVAIMSKRWEVENPKLDLGRFPSMAVTLKRAAGDGQLDGMTLSEGAKALADTRDSGWLGRYSLPWVAWALERTGYQVCLTGGVAAPRWGLRYVKEDQDDGSKPEGTVRAA